MIPLVARQSVIIKCNSISSVLLGNYEFYYAGGLMCRLFGLHADADMPPRKLCEYLQEKIPQIQPNNEKEGYLLKLVAGYDPQPDYDGQMRELFAWGAAENDLWQIKTTRDL